MRFVNRKKYRTKEEMEAKKTKAKIFREAQESGYIRYPDTMVAFGMPYSVGDFDRAVDGKIKEHLADLGYIDNEEEVMAGVLRLKVRCSDCRGKTDFDSMSVYCLFGGLIRETQYYKCRDCGALTSVDEREATKFERGFWDK